MRASTFIALLRGINVGGHNRVPMSELRSACEDHGWAGAQTYIQSGNLLLRAPSAPARVEEELERLIERTFGLTIAVIVRTAAEWSASVRRNPFPDASRTEPMAVMLALSKERPRKDAAAELAARAADGERIERAGDDLWIHFARGMGKSKLSPQVLDRLVGSPVTMRNWRTVVTLEEMAVEVDRGK